MIETSLRIATEAKVYNPTVKSLFESFCEYGILTNEAGIIDSIPTEFQKPIIHTLKSHITKEKPVMVYSILRSSGVDVSKCTTISASVDLLWALSIMYDDMFDQDEKRSGEPSAWVKYGSDTTFKSANLGLEAVKSSLVDSCGVESHSKTDEFVNRSLVSLKVHKAIKIDAPIDEILNNYRQRSLFHTALPFSLAGFKDFGTDQGFLALENVNLAGQILNDLKDFSPKYFWVRESCSDIRSGLVTVPSRLLFDNLNQQDKNIFLDLFGSNRLANSDKENIFKILIGSGAYESVITLARNLYNISLNQFKQSVEPQFLKHAQDWINFKLEQLADLT